jgi:hypothetical protein
MKRPLQILFRVSVTVLGATITFWLALVLTAMAYTRWVLPSGYGFVLIKVFGPISLGALACAVLVIILGTRWTLKAVRIYPHCTIAIDLSLSLSASH